MSWVEILMSLGFRKNYVLLCSFKAQGQKIMFHLFAMGNTVTRAEFFILMWA
jgi:hypothetical protein